MEGINFLKACAARHLLRGLLAAVVPERCQLHRISLSDKYLPGDGIASDSGNAVKDAYQHEIHLHQSLLLC